MVRAHRDDAGLGMGALGVMSTLYTLSLVALSPQWQTRFGTLLEQYRCRIYVEVQEQHMLCKKFSQQVVLLQQFQNCVGMVVVACTRRFSFVAPVCHVR